MNSTRIVILTVILTVVILLNLPLPASLRVKAGAHNAVAPFQNTISLLINKTTDFFTSILHPHRKSDNKKEMLTEIAELKLRLNSVDSIKQENIALRKMINFKNRQDKKLLICEVVSRNGTTGWWQTITVNRGKNDGIVKGSAVMTTDGLIGRIHSVSKTTSTIQLITDYTCNISCTLPRTKAFGIVKGEGISINGNTPLEILCPINPMKMDYISKEVSIKQGDLVITSGLGEIFPAKLVVGHIIKSELDRSGLYQRATITPAANLSELHYVFILTDNINTEVSP